jgi:cytochrome P450
MIRWTSPVRHFLRYLTEPATLAGVEIPAGDRLLLSYPSANRDEDVFTDPDAFDVGRTPNDHLGFGIGPHFCLGANLARREIRVMFEELFRRLPDIRVSGPPDMLQSFFIHGIKRMPVEFTPGSDRR